MPKKLYNILDENGNELKGAQRKIKLDEMRRQRLKTKPPAEEPAEDSEDSIIDYGPNAEPEITVTEEELERYIKEKEQKNYIAPPVQQVQAGVMSNIMTSIITTTISTAFPILLLMGLQKYTGNSTEESNTESKTQQPINSSKPTQKANTPKFSPFMGQN